MPVGTPKAHVPAPAVIEPAFTIGDLSLQAGILAEYGRRTWHFRFLRKLVRGDGLRPLFWQCIARGRRQPDAKPDGHWNGGSFHARYTERWEKMVTVFPAGQAGRPLGSGGSLPMLASP